MDVIDCNRLKIGDIEISMHAFEKLLDSDFEFKNFL